MANQHDAPTVALDPAELARAGRAALRVSILELINECARTMAMPRQSPSLNMRLRELIEHLTNTLDELAQVP